MHRSDSRDSSWCVIGHKQPQERGLWPSPDDPEYEWQDIEVFDVRHIERVLGQGIATPVRQLSQSPSPRRVPPTPRLSPFTFHLSPFFPWRLGDFARHSPVSLGQVRRGLQVDAVATILVFCDRKIQSGTLDEIFIGLRVTTFCWVEQCGDTESDGNLTSRIRVPIWGRFY